MLIDYENVWKAIDELETNAIILIDNKGFIRKINKGVTAILGFSEHDLIGERVETLMSYDVVELHQSLFAKYVEFRKNEINYKSTIN